MNKRNWFLLQRSFGCILYELITLKPLFNNEDDTLKNEICNFDFSKLNLNTTPILEKLCQRLDRHLFEFMFFSFKNQNKKKDLLNAIPQSEQRQVNSSLSFRLFLFSQIIAWFLIRIIFITLKQGNDVSNFMTRMPTFDHSEKQVIYWFF